LPDCCKNKNLAKVLQIIVKFFVCFICLSTVLYNENSDEKNFDLEYVNECETLFTNDLSANQWPISRRLIEEN
jgi:hypothetical protein